jgi:DnaD/phage-associated family protein
MSTLRNLLKSNASVIANKSLMHSLGTNETIIYSELLSRNEYFEVRGLLTEDGFFYNTVIDLQRGTACGDKTQRSAIKKLVNLGLIETQLRENPAKRFFKIIDNDSLLTELIQAGQKMINELEARPRFELRNHETRIESQYHPNGGTSSSTSSTTQTAVLVPPKGQTNNTNLNNTNLRNRINNRARANEQNKDIKTEADEARTEIIKGKIESCASSAVEISDFKKAIQLLEENLTRPHKKVYGEEYREIKKLVKGQGLVLFTAALRETVLTGTPEPVPYIKSIMERWAKKGITTIEGVKADQAEFEAKKEADTEKLRILQGQLANRRKSASSKYEDYEEKNNLTPKPVSKYQKFYQ